MEPNRTFEATRVGPMPLGRGLFIATLFAMGCSGEVIYAGGGGSGSGSGSKASGVASTSKGVGSTGTGGVQCPKEAPVAGEPCAAPGLVCSLPFVCCQPSASCIGGHWSISEPACGQPCISCGPSLACSVEAVCVSTQITNTVIHQCEANPCQGQPLSCGCAAALCEAIPATCVSASGLELTCTTNTKG